MIMISVFRRKGKWMRVLVLIENLLLAQETEVGTFYTFPDLIFKTDIFNLINMSILQLGK